MSSIPAAGPSSPPPPPPSFWWRLRSDADDDDRRPRLRSSSLSSSAAVASSSAASSSSSRSFSSSSDGKKLYVGNLPPDATHESVRELFVRRLKSGDKVIDCFLSRGGYAFVTVPAGEERDLCGGIDGANGGGGLEMGGRTLKVGVALPGTDRREKKKKREEDDGGPVVASSSVSPSSPSSSAAVGAEDLRRMSLGQLADMRTVPGWDLVHNPPRRNPRGALVGTVVSDKMQKTVNVAVDRYRIVPKYRKRWKFTRKFMAHDEGEVCNEGDLVMIVPCQKISRHKHFMVREIIRRKGQL